jgi:hypothetical protein
MDEESELERARADAGRRLDIAVGLLLAALLTIATLYFVW